MICRGKMKNVPGRKRWWISSNVLLLLTSVNLSDSWSASLILRFWFETLGFQVLLRFLPRFLRSSSPLIRFRIRSVFFSSLKLFLVIAFWFELQEGGGFDDEDSLWNLRISGIRISFLWICCWIWSNYDETAMNLKDWCWFWIQAIRLGFGGGWMFMVFMWFSEFLGVLIENSWERESEMSLLSWQKMNGILDLWPVSWLL
jgi:hypothetical protein